MWMPFGAVWRLRDAWWGRAGAHHPPKSPITEALHSLEVTSFLSHFSLLYTAVLSATITLYISLHPSALHLTGCTKLFEVRSTATCEKRMPCSLGKPPNLFFLQLVELLYHFDQL